MLWLREDILKKSCCSSGLCLYSRRILDNESFRLPLKSTFLAFKKSCTRCPLYKNIYKDLVLWVMTLLCRASMVWSPALSQPTCGLVLSWSSTASSSSRALWKTSLSPSPTLPSSPWPHCEWRPPCSCASCSPYTPSPPPSQRSPECGTSRQQLTEKWSHI